MGQQGKGEKKTMKVSLMTSSATGFIITIKKKQMKTIVVTSVKVYYKLNKQNTKVKLCINYGYKCIQLIHL